VECNAGLRRTVAEYSSWVSAAHAAASPPPPPSGDTVSSSTVAGAGAGGCGFVAFTCSSWLLDPHYQDVLSEHSNIVKFQRECYCYPTGAYSIVRKNGESVLRSNFADLPRHARDKHNQESLSEPVLANHRLSPGKLNINWCSVIPQGPRAMALQDTSGFSPLSLLLPLLIVMVRIPARTGEVLGRDQVRAGGQTAACSLQH
jgi:hypothetical protein